MLLLADFSTRLVCGLVSLMLVTSPRMVSATYFRSLIQIVLGLGVLTALTAWPDASAAQRTILVLLPVFAFVGSVVWSLGRSRFGQVLNSAIVVCTLMVFVRVAHSQPDRHLLISIADALSSAWLLGATLAAMLLGHSYLIHPTMSISPLRRMVGIMAGAVLLRAALAGSLLSESYARISADVVASPPPAWWGLLAARWIIGLAAPLLVCWMVWMTARIRSTQSATGILYVGVIVTFLGELADLLIHLP